MDNPNIWVSLVSLIFSGMGLLFSMLSFYKIKEVKIILRQKTMKNSIITNIEDIMRYQENQPITADQKRNIENILSSIFCIINKRGKKHQYERNQIDGIKKELSSRSPNIKNIKGLFKTLKAMILSQGDE